MTYQVLARKYRPQKFTEVVGQDHVTTTLKNALAANRLHHAYLFTGVRGVGKTTVARILAKALNCEKREGFEPCGVCGICAEIANGTSLDVQEIDGASNTGVDDVRELRERTKYLPSGKYKIYIIDEVHMLSTSAFNALLKTLEEPPPHVIFIFATTEPHKIPATILSRCQRYDFRRIPVSAISKMLQKIAHDENVGLDESALLMLSREATGSLRDAESLFDQAIAFSGNNVSSDSIKSMLGFLDRKLLLDIVDAVISRDAKRALGVLDEVFETGADLVRFTMDILEMLKNLLILSECGEADGAVDVLPDEMEMLRGLVKKVKSPELHQMFGLWYRLADEVARSAFPKMIIEVGLIRLCRVGPVKSIEEIVAKMDAVLTTGDVGARRAVPLPMQNAPSPGQKSDPGWEEFMRWLVNERPQIASIFSQGELQDVGNDFVKMKFTSDIYADMLLEDARKLQAENYLKTFFKRPLMLQIEKIVNGEIPESNYVDQKKELVRDALTSDIVRHAAEILNAEIHEVKIK